MDAGHKIVGIGHNKLPDGVDEEKFSFWNNRDIKNHGFMNTKYPYGEYQLSPNPCIAPCGPYNNYYRVTVGNSN